MMLRDGGIYNVHYSDYYDYYDVYIVIITITEYIYYYEIEIINQNNTDLSINNQYMVNILEEHINLGLEDLHNFYIKEKVNTLEKKIDGYLGQITNEQLIALTLELYKVEFD